MNPCPICGQHIPDRPRGSRHGHPPKTCSEACRKERARRVERARYHAVKHTDSWKSTRVEYLRNLRAKLDADPEFAAVFRAHDAERLRQWRRKLRESDPAGHAETKVKQRARMAAWRQRIVSDPEAWEAHKAKCRAWYAQLSESERERIYYTPRRARKAERTEQP